MLYTGIDIIEIPRVRRVVERWGERFLRRVFTQGELADCSLEGERNPVPPILRTAWNYPSLAARWAAKEATAKALGVGLRGLGARWKSSLGVGFTEIEVVRGTLGRPILRLHGAAVEAAQRLGMRELSVSLSHERDYAVASVVGIGADDGGSGAADQGDGL